MAILLEHLLQERNRWAIQVIQHTVSLLSNMPLRLMNWQKMAMWDPGPEQESFLHHISDTDLAFYKKRRNTPWITTARNIHPLVDYLRRNWTWLACERQFFRRWLGEANGAVCGPERYFTDDMRVAAYRLNLKDIFEGFLVVGPVFARPLEMELWPGLTRVVDRLVEKVGEEFEGHQVENTFDDHEMRLRGRGTGWVYQECLKDDAEIVGNTLKAIFETEIEGEIGLVRNRAYNTLAQIAYLLHKEPSLITNAAGKAGACEELLFRMDRNNNLVLRALPGNDSWRFSLFVYTGLQDKRVRVRLKPPCDPGAELGIEKKLIKATGELVQSFAYRQHGFMGQKVKRLSRWLHNTFGVISAELQKNGEGNTGKYREPPEKDEYRELARRILELFCADMVSIFIYHHAETKLKAKIVSFQQELDEKKRADWQNAEYLSMAKASNDRQLRQRSIAYRAADKKEEQFCQALLFEGTGRAVAVPADQLILNPYPEPFERRSAIAVPMLVHGLLFGVLEIDGFCQYQFRRDSVQLAQEIADIIGPFLYQREVLRGLSALSESVLNDEKPTEKKYTGICEVAAQVFLANASVLFMPPGQRVNEFSLVASYNRDDLKPLIAKEGYSLRGLEDDSPVIQAFQSGRYFNRLSIRELEEKYPGWRDRVPTRKSTAELFSHLTVIPIRDPRNPNSEDLCALSLYYVHGAEGNMPANLLSERWEPTAQLMSLILAMSVGAMHTRRIVEESTRRFFTHEVMAVTNGIQRVGQKLVDLAEKKLGPTPDQLTIIADYQDDLQVFGQHLRKLSLLMREDRIEKLARSASASIYEVILREDYGDSVSKEEIIENLGTFLFRIADGYWKPPHEFRINISEDVHHTSITTRKFLLDRMFRELLENATKYTAEPHPIEVQAKVGERAIEISVSNIGECLESREEKLRIFEWGFRGHNARAITGGGLGLHIVRTASQILECEVHDNIETANGLCRFTFQIILPREVFAPKDTRKTKGA